MTTDCLIHIRYFVLAGLMIAASLQGAAQELPGEQIEVIKDFDARLVDARKLPLRPKLPPPDTTVKEYTYRITVDIPDLDYPAPALRPLAIRPEKPTPVYRGNARAGYGFPNTILGDAHYTFVQQEDLQLTADVSHHSANKTDVPLQKFSETAFGLSGVYYSSPALSVSGDFRYALEDVYFYGKEPDDIVLYIDEKRKFKTFTGAVKIENNERLPGDINYLAELGVYSTKGDLGARENGASLSLRGEKWIAGKHPASLTVITDFSTLKDADKRDLNNFFLQPAFSFRGDAYKVDLGLNIAAHDDEYYFFPMVEGSTKILGNRLIAFAGVTGSLRKNNLMHLWHYNPFIHEQIDQIRNTEYTEFYGGVKGNIKVLEYQGKIAYTDANDLALFLPDDDDYRKFQPVYDSANIFRIEGALRATPMENLEAGVTLAKNFYDLSNEEKPWHLPGFEMRFYTMYSALEGKLSLRGDLFLENGVPYITEDDEVDRLNSLFDLSLRVDYYFSEHFGIFGHLNNLADNNRQRWQRYPTYGINGVAGLLVRW